MRLAKTFTTSPRNHDEQVHDGHAVERGKNHHRTKKLSERWAVFCERVPLVLWAVLWLVVPVMLALVYTALNMIFAGRHSTVLKLVPEFSFWATVISGVYCLGRVIGAGAPVLRPLSSSEHQEMLDLLDHVPKGKAFHQAVIAQGRGFTHKEFCEARAKADRFLTLQESCQEMSEEFKEKS